VSLYIIGIMVVFSIVLLVYALWPSKKGEESEAIKRRMSGRRVKSSVASIRKQAKESVAKRVMTTVAPIAVKPVMMSNADDISKLRLRLATAGFRSASAPTMFLASKTVLAVALALAGVAYSLAKGATLLNGAGITMVCAGIGLLAPRLWLSMAISKRAGQVRCGLPDALDMMVISVESGLGLDAAVQRVGDEMRNVHPILAEELQIVTLESQMGIPRAEALDNFAARTALEEARSIVAVINQAERFGTSISRALRNQSDALRVKRRQAAEERAQKTTVKLMAPLILFIFPAILVVLAGPAALKMMEALTQTSLTG
jgi:tight adherence protein C